MRPSIQNAIRNFYIYTTGFMLMSASYSVTEYLRDEEDVQSSYWFFLYGSIFIAATALSHFAHRVHPEREILGSHQPDEELQPTRRTHNIAEKAVVKAHSVFHFFAETAEDGLLTTSLISDIHSQTPNNSAILLGGCLSVAAVRALLLRHHEKHPHRWIEEGNRWIYNSVRCMAILYGLGYNWVYNDFNALSGESVAQLSAGIGAGLVISSNLIETAARHFQLVSDHALWVYRRGALMAEEIVTANIFFTVFMTNTMATILRCDEECSDTALEVTFYTANVLGLMLGVGRAMNLVDYKSHRVTEMQAIEPSKPSKPNENSALLGDEEYVVRNPSV